MQVTIATGVRVHRADPLRPVRAAPAVYSVVLDEVDADPGLYGALNGLNRGLTH